MSWKTLCKMLSSKNQFRRYADTDFTNEDLDRCNSLAIMVAEGGLGIYLAEVTLQA